MKKIILPFFLLLVGTYSFTQSILPHQSTSLFDHMVEINKKWLNYPDSNEYQHFINFTNDWERIQTHLYLVEQQLRENPPAELNKQQLDKRNYALDILKLYYKNKRFPVNYYHSVRQPYFIDDHGTACAVGQLIIETGFESVAKKIAQENNYAYIHELTPLYPEIEQWAEMFGFTLDELAWIQPGYPPAPQMWYPMGNGGSVNGQINVMKTQYPNADLMYLGGDFTEIDGVEANSIIAWDGTNWHTLGNGVSGEVHDIYINSSGRVYIVGGFYVYDSPDITDAAYWSNGEWHPIVENQHIEGTVYTIHGQSTLFIGGDFVIETSFGLIENIAFKKFSDSLWQNADGDFSVNGVVYDFLWNEELLVAGHFTETGVGAVDTSSVNKLSVNGLAYWDPGNENANIPSDWVLGFNPTMNQLISVAKHDGWLSVGSNESYDFIADNPFMGIFSAGFWDYVYASPFVSNYEEQMFHGFTKHNGGLYAFGNITHNLLISEGLIPIVGSNLQSTRINNTVTAAESFQGNLYVAGDFTQIFDQTFNGLAFTSFEPLTSNEEVNSRNSFSIYSSPTQVHIQYEQLQEAYEITFYNLNGQQLSSTLLPQGSAEVDVTTQNWTAGVYVYQAVSTSGQVVSGKVFIK